MARANIKTRAAINEVKKLVKELNELRETVKRTGNASKASFDKLESSTASLKAKYAQANTTISKLNATIKKQESQMNKTARANKKAADSVEKVGKNSKKANSSMGSLAGGVKSLFAAFGLIVGIQLFANIIRDAAKLILTFDSLRFAMIKITEDSWGYAQSQEFLLILNRKYGAELIVTTERWIKFLAAAKQSNMTLLATERIFESVTKASASLGLSTDDLKSVYLALEQMLSKGKVTTEELRRQLGEKLPGAMGIMAAAIGVTIPKLDEMLKKGEVMSAEVLPDFANALEIAYGIDAVEKVDTLRATLGRLSGGWQTFVANIGESEGPFMQAIGSMLGGVDKLLNKIIRFNADEAQAFRIDIRAFREGWEVKMQADAKKAYDIMTGWVNKDKDIRAAMLHNRIKVTNTVNEEEIKSLNEHYDYLVKSLVEYGKGVEAQKRAIAADGFLELKKEKEELEKVHEESAKEIIKWEKIKDNTLNGFNRNRADEEIKRLKDEAFLRRGIILDITAEYNVKRKLLEVGGDPGLADEEESRIKMKKRKLEEIVDLEKQLQIAIIKQIMAGNEWVLDAEETGWEKRIQLVKKQQILSNRISQLQLDIEIEQIRKAEKDKLAELNRPNEENEIGFSVKQKKDQELAITKEANQKIEIAEKEHYQNIIKNGNSAYSTLLGITESTNKEKVEIIEDAYNKEIIAAKESFEASNKGAKAKITLERELKRIARESANAQIDGQIAILKAKVLNIDADEEIIAGWERLINKLEASKQNMFGDEDSAEKFKEDLEEMLGYLSEYSQAIGGIVDGMYGRRIEAINAEIDAEKTKYDALILLAENNEEQKETLMRNRDLKIAALEKKRLKEEQKQAKARKAFAVADIVINTAVAISKVLGQAGIFGIPLVPVVAALGALQVAAVLAQPIPQYKDGSPGIKKDEVAMINDGIAQEYVERNGNILTTRRKNAIVNLKQGDIVHKDYKSLDSNSDVISGVTGGSYISENDFNRLFMGVTSSIVDGFKKAKINNNIKVASNNNSYRDKMSRWNG